MSLREELLALAAQTKAAMEPVKFLGRDLFVREMTSAERVAYELDQDDDKGGNVLENFRGRLLARTLVGEDGERAFTNEDADAIGAIPNSLTIDAFNAAAKLNGLTSEKKTAAEKK